MAKRAHTTLLLLESNAIRRADFSGEKGGGPDALKQQPRDRDISLTDAVRIGLGLSDRCAKNVWVLSDEFWTHDLSLPAAAVSNLSAAEIAPALAFEAEPLSGIPSTHAAIGFLKSAPSQLSDRSSFATVAMDSDARDEIQALIQEQSATLRGIASLRHLPPPGSDEREWLKHCLASLAAQPAQVPVIPAAPRIVKPARYWITALALEAAVLALCFGHSKWIERENSDAQSAIQNLQAPKKILVETMKRIASNKLELSKRESDNAAISARIDAIERDLARQRERVAAMLKKLTSEKPRDVALLSIQPTGTEAQRIDGVSLMPTGADAFAVKLDSALKPVGLSAHVTAKTAQRIADNGGPWHFEIVIAPVAPIAPGTSTASASPHQKGDDSR